MILGTKGESGGMIPNNCSISEVVPTAAPFTGKEFTPFSSLQTLMESGVSPFFESYSHADDEE